MYYSKTESYVKWGGETRIIGEVEAGTLFLVVQWKLNQGYSRWYADWEDLVASWFGRNQPTISYLPFLENQASMVGLSCSSRGLSLQAESFLCLVLFQGEETGCLYKVDGYSPP